MSRLQNKNNDFILDKKNKGLITKYGTTLSNDKPKVVYLRTKAKITPLENKQTYEDDIDSIKEDFKNFVDDTIKKNILLCNDYISSIDISSKSVAYGKVSFLRYDIYLKPLIRKTTEGNKKIFKKLSEKLDKKLLSLLHNHKIECKN